MPITINGNGAISGLGDIDGHDLETATLVVSGDTTIAPQAVGRATLFVDESANRVGINTTTPGRLFQASDGTNPILSVINTATSAEGVLNAPADGTVNVGSATNNTLTLSTNSAARVTVLAGGNVGIGTTVPDRRLSVSSSDGLLARFIGPTNNLFIANDRSGLIDLFSTGTGDSLTLGTESIERVRITNDGRVGINTDDPDATLEVGESPNANIGNQSCFIKGTKTNFASNPGLPQNQLLIYDDTASTQGSGGSIAFAANAGPAQQTWIAAICSERESNTNDNSNYAGSLAFYVRQAQSIPREAARFNSTGNLAFPDGQGIDFSARQGGTNGTVDNSLLDDYEEGVWTPRVTFDNANFNGTYSISPSGNYIKIGQIVHMWWGFRFSTLGTHSSTASMQIVDMPYSALYTAPFKHPAGSMIVTQAAVNNLTAIPFAATGNAMNFRCTNKSNQPSDDATLDISDLAIGSACFGSIIIYAVSS